MQNDFPKKKKVMISSFLGLAVVAIAFGLFFWNQGREDRIIEDTDSYQTRYMDGCTIVLPENMQRANDPDSNDKSISLGYFSNGSTAISIKKYEGRSTKEEIFTALQKKEFEGQTVGSKLVGDFVIADKDTQIVIGSESKPGKMLIGYYFADENYYQIIAVCHSDKADTYLKYMEDWITSFKLTD